VDTAAIRYRVTDFLKKHPPFHVMEEEDLLQLAQKGRVKFFEPNQYVFPKATPRLQVLVIQQGTVLLWDERGVETRLIDVRGAGDMLGIEHVDGLQVHPYAARSASDVLVYAFPAVEFDELVEKYPTAKQYVSAYGSVATDYRSSQERRGPHNVSLNELTGARSFPTCDAQTSIREAARAMLATGCERIAVLDAERRPRTILTPRSFLEWITRDGGDTEQPVTVLPDAKPLAIAEGASVADGVLAMGRSAADVLFVTSDGTQNSPVQAMVTSQHLGLLFGDRPVEILRQIQLARDTQALREVNDRARSLVLQYLTGGASSEWLAEFTFSVDSEITRRILAFACPEDIAACWCFCGSSGRRETLTRLAPRLVMIVADGQSQSRWEGVYRQVLELQAQCGYLPNEEKPFEPLFYAASSAEWRKRYQDWVNQPVINEIYPARPLFDLCPVRGLESLWKEVEGAVTGAINHEFLHVVANDCLATLPPLTFFQNAVVDETGEETAVFRLEESALRPLVDVGRVFGMAGRKVFGTSTLERFALARRSISDDASIFEEASATLRVVLWQQGRVGLSQGTAGSELPPGMLSRYDRQILRTGFRSILRLLEFTADSGWLKKL
jgi:CBS domain-containing protein